MHKTALGSFMKRHRILYILVELFQKVMYNMSKSVAKLCKKGGKLQ